MTQPKNRSASRTLLVALLMSAPGPLITGLSAAASGSPTQLADFVRRTAELVASFMSWYVYRRIARNAGADRARLDRLAGRTVAWAMLLSGTALLFVGIRSLVSYTPAGNVMSGFIIAVLGLVMNTLFFARYTRLARREGDAVLEAQRRLYRAKAVVDACVVAALAAVLIAPAATATRYIDALGTITVACYLFYNGVDMLRRPRK